MVIRYIGNCWTIHTIIVELYILFVHTIDISVWPSIQLQFCVALHFFRVLLGTSHSYKWYFVWSSIGCWRFVGKFHHFHHFIGPHLHLVSLLGQNTFWIFLDYSYCLLSVELYLRFEGLEISHAGLILVFVVCYQTSLHELYWAVCSSHYSVEHPHTQTGVYTLVVWLCLYIMTWFGADSGLSKAWNLTLDQTSMP